MNLIRFVLPLFLMVFSFLTPQAQESQVVSYNYLSEKIYLQLDNEVYTNDQTIWFKGIVLNSLDHRGSDLSEVLVVEIINDSKKVEKRKLIKLEEGIGLGFFDLGSDFKEGTYLIRAYTDWNRNFVENFQFEKYIKVFASVSNSNLISNTTIQYEEDFPQLSISLNGNILDTIDIKNYQLNISANNIDSSFPLSRNGDGEYLYNVKLADTEGLIDVAISNKNETIQKKVVALNTSQFDVQFFPEGGKLIVGIPTRIGFKAIDEFGNGLAVEGQIIDENGKLVQNFESNKLGMGSFYFMPELDKRYFTKVNKLNAVATSEFDFPIIEPVGTALQLNKGEDHFKVAISSNENIDSVSIEIISRGVLAFKLKGKLNAGKLLTTLSFKDLPDGIIAVRVLDGKNLPVAERLIFNERRDQRIRITANEDFPTEQLQREKSTLTFHAKNQLDEFINADFSIKVIDVNELGSIQGSVNTMISYLLLDSELKGKIQNPNFYFDKDSVSNYQALDDLLLTQGWRSYNYSKTDLFNLDILPEKNLEVSGKLSGNLLKNPLKQPVNLTLMAFGSNTDFQTQETDSLGRFYFSLNDEFGEKLDLLLQTKKTNSKSNSTYKIEINERVIPEILLNPAMMLDELLDPQVKSIVEQNQLRESIQRSFNLEEGIDLDEVVIRNTRLSPEREKLYRLNGEPNIIIAGSDIQAKEKKWSYGLYSVLLFSFPKEIEIYTDYNMRPGGVLNARVIGGSPANLVMIDGIPVRLYEYPLIQDIPPSEVTSVEILRDANGFGALWLAANMPGQEPPINGNIIAIFTKAGRGLGGAYPRVGVEEVSIPVFAMSKEFYTPKYESLTPQSWIKPDLRSLIEWKRSVKTENGKATITYYNGDLTGDARVIIEAITPDGRIGYQEFDYKVNKRVN